MSVAFICPVYDMKNHFELAEKLAYSKIKNNIANDLFFVFSNEKQKDKFWRMIRLCNNSIKWLILPNEFEHYHSKAGTKKFFAMKFLMNNYKYLIVIDCETEFIKECDFDAICDKIWNTHNTLAANKSIDGFFIQRFCYKALNIYDDIKLRKETGTYIYNYWFNEIQVYNCESLKGFFKWIEEKNVVDELYDKCNFEYYAFGAYLILNEGWHIKKTKYRSMGGIMEYLFMYSRDKQQQIISSLNSHWSSDPNIILPDTVMLFHLDRKAEDLSYGYSSRLKIIGLYIRRWICILSDKLNLHGGEK